MKRTVAKVVGAGIVGAATAFVVRALLGKPAEAGAVGAIAAVIAHEMFNAPVSDWVYKQI
ncbi:MAG: hypothetical protein ABSD85_17680 [Acidimicrobiales bacterium]|jgi:hypothetical protein